MFHTGQAAHSRKLSLCALLRKILTTLLLQPHITHREALQTNLSKTITEDEAEIVSVLYCSTNFCRIEVGVRHGVDWLPSSRLTCLKTSSNHGAAGKTFHCLQQASTLLLLRRCPRILLTLTVLSLVKTSEHTSGSAPACLRSAAAPLLHGKQPAARLGSARRCRVLLQAHARSRKISQTWQHAKRNKARFSSLGASAPSALPISSRSSRRYRKVTLRMFVRNVGASSRLVPLAAFDIHARFHWGHVIMLERTSAWFDVVAASRQSASHHIGRTCSWK